MMWQIVCTFTPGKAYRVIGWFLSAEEFEPKFPFQKGLINKNYLLCQTQNQKRLDLWEGTGCNLLSYYVA